MEKVGQLFVAILGITASKLISGYVLIWLWHWFIVPFGIQQISLTHAVGISVIVGYITYQGSGKTDDKDFSDAVLEAISQTIAFALLALATGYVVSRFM